MRILSFKQLIPQGRFTGSQTSDDKQVLQPPNGTGV